MRPFPATLAFICLMFVSSIGLSQTTLTLQPDAVDGKDALLHGLSSEASTNFGSNNQLSANTWTYSGTVGKVRFLVEFDLSSIPIGAMITNAELSLFGIGDNSGFGGHSTLSGSNEAWLQRVTAPWDENLVTWNTQPSTSAVNQVGLIASTGTDDDYVDLDVTSIVQDMMTNGNNGFLVKLQTEEHYRRLNFASSDHSDPSMRPKLVVTYTNDPCITLRPGSDDGKDALLHGLSSEVNTNYGSNNQLSANTWTYSGTVGTVRSVLAFDLTGVPVGSVVTSAQLSLYGVGDNSGFGGHSTLSGSNEALVQRVTSTWNESTVTWSNQPSTTSVNQIGLAPSAGVDDDYYIDVTALTQDMMTFGNNGFMIKLQTEDHYRRLNFGSSDHTNPSMRPTLKVCYQDTLVGIDEQVEDVYAFSLFPNPASESITLDITNGEALRYQLAILDAQGKVLTKVETTEVQTNFDVSAFENGMYFITVEGEKGKVSKRFVVNR